MSKYVIDCDHNKLKLLSDDFCIEYLQQSGWMQNHDKKVFEQGKECGVNDIASNIAYAREAGYEDGYNAGYSAAQTGEYQRGLEDAWEAALEIVTPDNMGGKYTSNELRTIFGVDFDYECLRKYKAAEVIRMLYDYEKKKEAVQAICVGDEVKLFVNTSDMEPLVVTAIMPENHEDLLCITVRGKYTTVQSKQVVKTGRHFDQVSDLLKAMRENDG